jgi:hypothetical protein
MATNDKQTQNTYYVACLGRYVLVHAGSIEEARAMGEEELGRPARVVRFATDGEMSFQEQHDRVVQQEAERQYPPTMNQTARRAKDCLFTSSAYGCDHGLFRSLGLPVFRNIAGKHKVGCVQIAGHRVEVGVICMPAQFWEFHVAGPHFQGELSTGSGTLTDYWWAVEALAKGQARITCPGDIFCQFARKTAGDIP